MSVTAQRQHSEWRSNRQKPPFSLTALTNFCVLDSDWMNVNARGTYVWARSKLSKGTVKSRVRWHKVSKSLPHYLLSCSTSYSWRVEMCFFKATWHYYFSCRIVLNVHSNLTYQICICGKLSITDNKLHSCHRDGWDRIQSLNPTTSQNPPSVASELSPARMSVPRTL